MHSVLPTDRETTVVELWNSDLLYPLVIRRSFQCSAIFFTETSVEDLERSAASLLPTPVSDGDRVYVVGVRYKQPSGSDHKVRVSGVMCSCLVVNCV